MQVVWLDVTVAKARFGRWIEGSLPQFGPFPKVGRVRGKKNLGPGKGVGGKGSDDSYWVNLRRLRSV